MIETIDVVIEEHNFKIQQFSWQEAQKMETRTMRMLAPVLGILEELDESTDLMDMDLKALAKPIQDVLTGIDENQMIDYIRNMVKQVFYEVELENGQRKMQQLNNDAALNNLFVGGSPLLKYKLLLEVMKVNRFAFFGFWDGGGKNIIDGM